MANIKIRLVVKTSENSPSKHCYLVDNISTPDPGEDPNNFCTKVDRAQSIEWSGLPENPNVFDQVSIDSISYTKKNPGNGKIEKDLFGVPNLTGSNGVIYGTIMANNYNPNDEEEYTIHFTIIRADGTTISDRVDPKLQMNA